MRDRLPEPYLAAAVQWAPAFHDVERGVERAVAAIEEAAASGARLIVFPETWLGGYPYWSPSVSWETTGEFRALHDELLVNAVVVPGPETDAIAAAAGRAGAVVVIGLHERDAHGSTLYNTLCYLGAGGALLGRHRKLVPTLTEKLVWGFGDGSDLDAYDTSAGRLGGLICYEHQMALARYACCELGVQVHASVWPGYEMLDPVIDAATRQLAYENGCFVVVARDVMDAARLRPGTPLADRDFLWAARGGSAIIAPGGEYVAGPVRGEETIVYGEIDLRRIAPVKWWFDGTGHYARPDVFRLQWDRRPKRPVETR